MACLNERQIAEKKKETRSLGNLSLLSTMYIAGTETKLVFLKFVGRKNSLPDPIHLRVQNQKEDNVRYLLDRSMPLRALMAHYCASRELPHDAFRFTYDGAGVPEAKSAKDLDMEDGDVIDTLADMHGGPRKSSHMEVKENYGNSQMNSEILREIP